MGPKVAIHVKVLSELLSHLQTLQENGKLQNQANTQGTILPQTEPSLLWLSCHTSPVQSSQSESLSWSSIL